MRKSSHKNVYRKQNTLRLFPSETLKLKIEIKFHFFLNFSARDSAVLSHSGADTGQTIEEQIYSSWLESDYGHRVIQTGTHSAQSSVRAGDNRVVQ